MGSGTTEVQLINFETIVFSCFLILPHSGWIGILAVWCEAYFVDKSRQLQQARLHDAFFLFHLELVLMTVQGWIYFVPCSHRYYALPFSCGLFHFHFYVIAVCYRYVSCVRRRRRKQGQSPVV